MAQAPDQDAPAAAMRELRMAVDVVSDALASANLDEIEKAEDATARAVAGGLDARACGCGKCGGAPP
jgi:hypothetical protein